KVEPPGDEFLEGGLSAWPVVLGAWCCMFVSVGWISCIGDFQIYYQTNRLRAYLPSSIGYIPSMQTFLLFVLAPIFGHLFDNYGPRPLLVGGTLSHVFGPSISLPSATPLSAFLSQITWRLSSGYNRWRRESRINAL
ncbi:hypothetical protein B0T24DRAFT_537000, partial [Lasiosphaeria ovina]